MRQHSDGSSTPVIDASVHIFCQSNKDLRQNFMREPFRSRGFPDYEMDWYGAPGGEYVERSKGPDRQYPGSDPALVGRHLFVDGDVDVAILHPMTRGIMPDRHLGTAIAAGAQRDDGEPLAGGRGVRRQVPRHHPGQPRRRRRRAAGDRQVQGPPARRADRHSAAVPRALRQAAVLAAVGSRRRGQSACGRAHRGWHRRRVRADAVRQYPNLRAVPVLHVAELPVSPDEHDRRGRIRKDARR